MASVAPTLKGSAYVFQTDRCGRNRTTYRRGNCGMRKLVFHLQHGFELVELYG